MLQILSRILIRAAADLSDAGAGFAVVGGIAIGARSLLRFTQDVDLAVSVASDQQAERIVRQLLASGYRLLMELDHKPTGRMATLRLISPVSAAEEGLDEPPLLDLLFLATGIEDEVVRAAEAITLFPGVILPTARLPHLIAMKLVAESDRRPQDRIDLDNLIQSASPDDLEEVGGLITLIHQRGLAGPKDLRKVYQTFLDRQDLLPE